MVTVAGGTEDGDAAPEGSEREATQEQGDVFHKAADVLASSWQEALVAVGSVGMGSAQFLRGGVDLVVWWFSAIAFILGTVFLAKRRPTRSQLLRERANLEAQVEARELDLLERLERYLAALTNDTLSLSDQCRTSLYRREEQRVTLLGRYSKNISFHKKGRIIYPLDQGCIGEALRNGYAVMHSKHDPSSDLDGYIREMHEDWGMPPEVTANINMKSRHILALALEDAHNAYRIGVVVVESVETHSFDVARIAQLLNAEEQKKLTSFLAAPESPQTEVAEEGDF